MRLCLIDRLIGNNVFLGVAGINLKKCLIEISFADDKYDRPILEAWHIGLGNISSSDMKQKLFSNKSLEEEVAS